MKRGCEFEGKLERVYEGYIEKKGGEKFYNYVILSIIKSKKKG